MNLKATEQAFRNDENLCSDFRILSKFNRYTATLESRGKITLYITHIIRAKDKNIPAEKGQESNIRAILICTSIIHT